MNAFLLLQGIETVALRIDRHVENALKVAEYLRDDSRVESVNFAGFADNPYYPLVQKYLGGRACSLMTFEIRGGLKAGMRFYNALKLFKRLVNLGDAKSLACHPASTTHRQMSPEEQLAAGRAPGGIRLTVRMERMDIGIVQMANPRYFGLVSPGASFPARCADRVASLFNPQLGSSASSPVPVDLERHVIRAIAQGAALGGEAPGHFATGGSEA